MYVLLANLFFSQLTDYKHTGLQSYLRSSYFPFFGNCCLETEKFREHFCFESCEHSVQTADENNKVTSRTL